jgi:signal transduction histidine kinase
MIILLPLSLLLLIALSTFTLLSYRNAVQDFAVEHRDRVLRAARAAAEALGRGEPEARALDRALAGLGTEAKAVLLGPGETGLSPLGAPPERPLAVGPSRDLPDAVAGFAPVVLGNARRTVRVDLPAPTLGAQQRGLAVLTAVVLGLDTALGLLLILFLRHLRAPWEALLARAREVHPEDTENPQDEAAFLLAAFERAAAALARSRPAEGGDDETRGEEDADITAVTRTLSHSLDSGLLLLGRDGSVLGLNDLGRSLLELPDPAPGTTPAELFAGRPDLEALQTVVEDAVGRREGVRRREIAVGARILGLTAHPLRRDDGETRGLLLLFTDLTESKRRDEEDRLETSLRELGEMAAGVAHELRNGLATLKGYLTLIERRPEEESVTDYLLEMRQESEHLERVLRDFLLFARPGSLQVGEVLLARVLERAAADPALPRPARVTADGPSGSPAVVAADATLLERAVKNLVHNAAQADPEHPPELSLHRGDGGVEVWVEDRGPGLPREVRERLFRPFVSGRPDGVGLGLTLAHRIVTLHGGRLWLEDRPGGGTRARLAFPADKIVT